MDKVQRYKKMYPPVDGVEELVLKPNGSVDLPIWLIRYFLHSTGLKSRKKRLVKKRIKRELIKLLKAYKET